MNRRFSWFNATSLSLGFALDRCERRVLLGRTLARFLERRRCLFERRAGRVRVGPRGLGRSQQLAPYPRIARPRRAEGLAGVSNGALALGRARL